MGEQPCSPSTATGIFWRSHGRGIPNPGRPRDATVSGEERWHLTPHLLMQPQGGLDSRCFPIVSLIAPKSLPRMREVTKASGKAVSEECRLPSSCLHHPPLLLPSPPASQRPYNQICTRRGSVLPVEQIHQLHAEPRSEVPLLGTISPKPKEKTRTTLLLAAPQPSLASGAYK